MEFLSVGGLPKVLQELIKGYLPAYVWYWEQIEKLDMGTSEIALRHIEVLLREGHVEELWPWVRKRIGIFGARAAARGDLEMLKILSDRGVKWSLEILEMTLSNYRKKKICDFQETGLCRRVAALQVDRLIMQELDEPRWAHLRKDDLERLQNLYKSR